MRGSDAVEQRAESLFSQPEFSTLGPPDCYHFCPLDASRTCTGGAHSQHLPFLEDAHPDFCHRFRFTRVAVDGRVRTRCSSSFLWLGGKRPASAQIYRTYFISFFRFLFCFKQQSHCNLKTLKPSVVGRLGYYRSTFLFAAPP